MDGNIICIYMAPLVTWEHHLEQKYGKMLLRWACLGGHKQT